MNDLDAEPVDLLVRARTVLLDALVALGSQSEAVVVIGAQAIYLQTGGVDVALAEATKDSDVALDPRNLARDPLVEAAMRSGGFVPGGQPGSWLSSDGIPVDLMVPEMLAGGGGRRGARIPPHDKKATRRARGLEAVLVDNTEIDVQGLDPRDARTIRARVAGPAGLLVAKLFKIAERVGTPDRLNDKDAHDIYRILRAVETEPLCEAFVALLRDELSRDVTRESADFLEELFARGPEALGAVMAGRAEELVGEPEEVALAVSLLASDLLVAVRSHGELANAQAQ
jgi:hypothetical protein